MPSFYISAAHKSSGKTTLSIGLAAALRNRGLNVQAFKKGPDYIDPVWLALATGSECYNLDFFTSSHSFILSQYQQLSQNKDAILVEGNMGLYDGLSLDGSDSNAAMAKLLQLPVILVVDCSGTSRGIAPLLNGYQQFDHQLSFGGVILNKLAGNRHESKLTEVINTYTDFKILGAVPRNNDIRLTERHLGLIPGNELAEKAQSVIDLLAQQARQYIDIDALLSIGPSPSSAPIVATSRRERDVEPSLRIAVPMDEAFGFYYPGDIQRFRQLGAEIVPFDALDDSALPAKIDGLFIGGGFPEVKLERLSANTSMRDSIRTAIEQGLPSYAECGGLMYLCRDLEKDGQKLPLCDVIPATVAMHERPQGRGYVVLQPTDHHPWCNRAVRTPEPIKAHEFHYSYLRDLPANMIYAYRVARGKGIDGVNDGIILHNMVASYTHLRATDQCSWVDDFVSFVKKIKRSQ